MPWPRFTPTELLTMRGRIARCVEERGRACFARPSYLSWGLGNQRQSPSLKSIMGGLRARGWPEEDVVRLTNLYFATHLDARAALIASVFEWVNAYTTASNCITATITLKIPSHGDTC